MISAIVGPASAVHSGAASQRRGSSGNPRARTTYQYQNTDQNFQRRKPSMEVCPRSFLSKNYFFGKHHTSSSQIVHSNISMVTSKIIGTRAITINVKSKSKPCQNGKNIQNIKKKQCRLRVTTSWKTVENVPHLNLGPVWSLGSDCERQISILWAFWGERALTPPLLGSVGGLIINRQT